MKDAPSVEPPPEVRNEAPNGARNEGGGAPPPLGPAEVGALAHIYRGEVYRSTVWRTRLDTTTNWSIVTLGLALSLTFSDPDASPLPLVLVGVLTTLFLVLEARRYRYFSMWRERSRLIETRFFVPMLRDGTLGGEGDWRRELAREYAAPEYQVTFAEALARRVRSNYLWIILVQVLAYTGKLVVHPTAATGAGEVYGRAAIGFIPGWLLVGAGLLYLLAAVALAAWITLKDARRRARPPGEAPTG